MASEEQYLDELLKTMENTNSRTMEETMRELHMGTELEPPEALSEAVVEENGVSEDAVVAPDESESNAEPELELEQPEAPLQAVVEENTVADEVEQMPGDAVVMPEESEADAEPEPELEQPEALLEAGAEENDVMDEVEQMPGDAVVMPEESEADAEPEQPEAPLEAVAEENSVADDMGDWQADLDELLQSMTGTESMETGAEKVVGIGSEDAEMASDLADIHAMLKLAEQSGLDDSSAEEMRALLQGIEETDASEPKEEGTKEKKKSKRKKFWKRKKKESEQQEEFFQEESADIQEKVLTGLDSENIFNEAESDIPEELLHGMKPEQTEDFLRETEDEMPVVQEEAETPVKEKKPGLFSRIMNFLMEEADEEPENSIGDGEQPETETMQENATGENAQILEELDSEKKKKKKGKKGKKGKQPSGEEAEGEEAAESGKAEKKEKKPREKKPKKEKVPMKKEPAILSMRVRLGLIAFGATFVAAILFLSIFLPEHADRLAAREAYYQGDYETAYQELNNQHLGASDALIYHRSETILTLQKKLTSYENRMALGQRVEALDALFRGVELYGQLIAEDTYGVADELTGIYQSICGILEADYGVSAQEAAEINTYDAQTYTRKLTSLANGTEFVLPGEEAAAELSEEPIEEPLQDVLEAEEELLTE